MRISIQASHIKVTEELNTQIQDKVAKLEHFYENIIDAIVFLHEEGPLKEVELKLNVKDNTIFLKEKAETFLTALDNAIDVMKIQLKKHKEKEHKNS